jgi:hypothetical protein
MRTDPRLLAEVAEIFHSHDKLKKIFNVAKVEKLLQKVGQGKMATRSFGEDGELAGGLATIAYAWEEMKMTL